MLSKTSSSWVHTNQQQQQLNPLANTIQESARAVNPEESLKHCNMVCVLGIRSNMLEHDCKFFGGLSFVKSMHTGEVSEAKGLCPGHHIYRENSLPLCPSQSQQIGNWMETESSPNLLLLMKGLWASLTILTLPGFSETSQALKWQKWGLHGSQPGSLIISYGY